MVWIVDKGHTQEELAKQFREKIAAKPILQIPGAHDAMAGLVAKNAEHEMPNSTFTARVIASTQSDMYGALTGAVASLKGHLHGGANEAVMYMLNEVETVTKDIFKEQLEMLLSFSYQYDLEGQKNYQLCYVPTFKHISGHIRAIDAKTGQYFYVEIGRAHV